MSSQRLRPIPPRRFAQMPAQTYPGGYVCLIRDVAYGNRYMLLRLRDPRGLKRRLTDDRNFRTELAYAWQAAQAAEAEALLREWLAPDAARGDWFDLADEQLAQYAAADYLSRPADKARQTLASQRRQRLRLALAPIGLGRWRQLSSPCCCWAVLLLPRFENTSPARRGQCVAISDSRS